MKKYSQNLMKATVGLTILIGVFLILIANEKSFRKIISSDIENISKLSAATIYAEINNSLTKPIIVGQTIASDLFLKNWLKEETTTGGNQDQTVLLQQYLSDYSEKYGYDSVSVISEKSGTYYYQNGINKVISTADAHDEWYYDFIKSGEMYKLNIDVDEANNNELTVFVDSRIENSDGELLGVTGVGIKMKHLQDLLQGYEKEYSLKALLIDKQGLIQVDSVEENIETANFFDNPETAKLKQRVLSNKGASEVLWYLEGSLEHCLITKYIENLKWYIVIEKDTAEIQQVLSFQMYRDLLIVGIIIALVLVMISYVIARYNRMLLKTASIDDVTDLPNFRMFQEIYGKNTRREACHQGVIFMFDIDHFKDINDKYGHLFGNTALYEISQIAKENIGNKGLVARFGGDEFVGIIYGEYTSAYDILNRIIKAVSDKQELGNATISLGATRIVKGSKLDDMIRKADIAMYSSKENGRNRITFFEEV